MTDPNALLLEATAAYNQGNWQRAFDLASPLLAIAPEHAGVHHVVGLAALGMKQMPLAIRHLQRALKLEPRSDHAAHFARALSLVNQVAVARVVVDKALALPPLDASTLDTLGVVLSRANEHDRACELYERAVAQAPDRVDLHYNLAKSLICLGRLERAEDEMESCLALSPQAWDVHLTLAQLRRQTPASNHLQRLRALLPDVAGDPAAQLNLHMALFKEYEDLADYSQAFEHLVMGKAAGRSLLPGDASARYRQMFEALMSAPVDAGSNAAGFASDEPIFVMGMPRSGTTLVDRIISSHPQVYSAGELQSFPMAFKYASGQRDGRMLDPRTIDRASTIDWHRLGESYVASTRPATGAKPRFVDKLPHNFLYAGFIARALPQARIICLRRDPMDSCLSNFRQLFARESGVHEYSFDLLDTGRYYVAFDRLMAHWQRLFPGRILEVQYESLVDEQERGTRQLLEFCGLPWDDACLRFENNPAPIATASAVQVRQPMNRGSVGRWRRYREQTADLRKLLVESGIVVRD